MRYIAEELAEVLEANGIVDQPDFVKHAAPSIAMYLASRLAPLLTLCDLELSAIAAGQPPSDTATLQELCRELRHAYQPWIQCDPNTRKRRL